MERIIFYILAIIILTAAVGSVTSKRILRAVVYLLFALLGIAGIYFMVDYTFMAAVQMAVYAGGIIILFVFSVFLVHHVEGVIEEPTALRKFIMAALSVAGAVVSLYLILSHPFSPAGKDSITGVNQIGEGFLSTGENGYILPFELISVLLLAAIIGSIIISKGPELEDKEHPNSQSSKNEEL